ncbi:MAG: TatD family hydrolase [Candidatus Eremiobacteraeota bacterium]|nr:TatD family hydrolase [Candidatus Eremiobacteraeota bacterium]
MFDTHAHVHDPAFDADRSEVVARARAAGVTAILTVGCDLADSRRALEAAAQYGLHASIGIHPHEAKDAPIDLAAALDALRSAAAVAPVAVGETGLDYHYDHSPRDIQRAVMVAQMRYARDCALPLIFHHREADDDFLAILRAEFAAPMRGVVHCFTGDAVQAQILVGEFGLKLGIGGVITFKTAESVREAVRAVGAGAIVLETDCPYLAPVPHRGRRNEPAFVAATAERLAALLETNVTTLVERTTATARALFGV